MSELKYDPELPFALTTIGGAIIGRAVNEFVANQLHKAMDRYGQVIDTTPKPKIPEDAEFLLITWPNEDAFTRRMGNSWYWYATEEMISHQELIDLYLENGEVTVLVRKDES